MNNKAIFKFFILILILFFLFFTIRNTYSKYVTTQDAATNLHISQWSILLNDELITQNMDFSDSLQVTYVENEHIAEGLIAPTSTGYFELTLTSTGTELPFEYELSLDHINSNVDDFRMTSYLQYDGTLSEDEINNLKADPNNFVQMTADQASITGQVFPPTDADGNILDTDVINKFIVYVSWYDEDDNILDNANDVIASKTQDAHGVINVNLNVTQLDLQNIQTP